METDDKIGKLNYSTVFGRVYCMFGSLDSFVNFERIEIERYFDYIYKSEWILRYLI